MGKYTLIENTTQAANYVLQFTVDIMLWYFNLALNPADNDQFTQMSFFHRFFNLQMDDLIDELPVEKRHLSKLIIICWI